jgi:hypothetical protein
MLDTVVVYDVCSTCKSIYMVQTRTHEMDLGRNLIYDPSSPSGKQPIRSLYDTNIDVDVLGSDIMLMSAI